MLQRTLDGGADKFGLDLGDTEEDKTHNPRSLPLLKFYSSTRERKGDLYMEERKIILV